MGTTNEAETQTAEDLREFYVDLNQTEGTLTKRVIVVDPDTTLAEAVHRIRHSKDEKVQRRTWHGIRRRGRGYEYSDVLRTDVPSGVIKEHRNGKLITILKFDWWDRDGLVSENFDITDQEGNEL